LGKRACAHQEGRLHGELSRALPPHLSSRMRLPAPARPRLRAPARPDCSGLAHRLSWAQSGLIDCRGLAHRLAWLIDRPDCSGLAHRRPCSHQENHAARAAVCSGPTRTAIGPPQEPQVPQQMQCPARTHQKSLVSSGRELVELPTNCCSCSLSCTCLVKAFLLLPAFFCELRRGGLRFPLVSLIKGGRADACH